MVAIILAGGLGTRLRSVTHDQIPKAMIEVQGKPFIYWQLCYLKKQGIKKIIVAVHFHALQIQEYVGTTFEGIEIKYSVERKPLGTGGAVRQALEFVKQYWIIVLNGDTFFPVNLKSMIVHHKMAKNQITLALKKLKNTDRYGLVTLNKSKQIIVFEEKKQGAAGYINGGIYFIKSALLIPYKKGKPFSLEHDLFEQKFKHIRIGGYTSGARFIDIGIPADYLQAQTFNLR